MNYFNMCCMLVGLLALCRSLRSSIVNTNILVLRLSLCMFMLHDRLTLTMETNLFSLPTEELIDSQKIRMTGFVPVISRKGRRRVIMFILLWTTASTWIFLIKKKDRSGDKSTFSNNRTYFLRCSQIYCFDMNFVQFYLLVVMDL